MIWSYTPLHVPICHISMIVKGSNFKVKYRDNVNFGTVSILDILLSEI